MTDFSNWTDEEINEAIAIKKGWWRSTHHDEDGMWDNWYTPRHTPSIYNQIPKYTNDWRLFGKLLEELPNCSLKRYGDKWSCGSYDGDDYFKNWTSLSDSPGRAVCETYLIWRHQE